jgi:hypothetical protein
MDGMSAQSEIRCPDCRKRLFDLELAADSRFALLIVCRCKKKFRVEFPNPDTGDKFLPMLVRA